MFQRATVASWRAPGLHLKTFSWEKLRTVNFGEIAAPIVIPMALEWLQTGRRQGSVNSFQEFNMDTLLANACGMVCTFVRDEAGITAIEYGLIAAVIATGVTAAFTLLNTGLQDAFTALAAKLVP